MALRVVSLWVQGMVVVVGLMSWRTSPWLEGGGLLSIAPMDPPVALLVVCPELIVGC